MGRTVINTLILFISRTFLSYTNAKRFQDKIYLQGINYSLRIQRKLRGTKSFNTASLVKTNGHITLCCLSALKETSTAVAFFLYIDSF